MRATLARDAKSLQHLPGGRQARFCVTTQTRDSLDDSVRRIEDRSPENQPLFERKLRWLCAREGVELPKLGMQAGLSKETLILWVGHARKGKPLPGYESSRRMLLEHYDLPPDFFTSHEEPETLAPRRFARAAEDWSDAGTYGMAIGALELLVNVDKIPEQKAWMALCRVTPEVASVQGFYAAARERLQERKGSK